jgi:tetratricopeptide (TPR) repeat protein
MSVIACPPEPIRAGTQSNDIQNPLTHKPDLTRRNSGSPLERFGKYTLCGIVVCLMILLVTLSLYRYKADVYFEHGRRSLGKSEITEAIQSYEMAVKYNPLALDYRNVLNGIYLKMAINGISKDRERITDGQTNIFPARIGPGGSRSQTTMWFANAITGAEEVQKLYPRDYHSAFTLGQAYNLLDRMSDEDMSKEAIKYYKRAITLHPFKFMYRNKLARLYAEKGLYEDAIHELKEAKSIEPSNQASYLNLAKVFMSDRERYEDAEAVLLEYIKGNPDREIIDIFRLLSYVYFKTSKWEEVLSQSKKIIQLDLDDLEAHKYAVMADFKLERYDDARTLCNRILDLSGTQNNTHSKYAKEMLELLSEK